MISAQHSIRSAPLRRSSASSISPGRDSSGSSHPRPSRIRSMTGRLSFSSGRSTGGSQGTADALAARLRSLGGTIETARRVRTLDELVSARAYLFDVTPRQLDERAGRRLSDRYRRRLRSFRYGPGVFKLDYAIDGPIPWRAKDCLRAGTVHLGGTLDEIAESEAQVARGTPAERPFILVGQQSLFDPSRAPAGKHTVWAYCHIPNGSTFDMTERMEAQCDRFAPDSRDRTLRRA